MIDFDLETTGLQAYSQSQRAFLYIFGDDEGNVEALPYTERERIQTWFDRAKSDPDGIRAWNNRFDRSFAASAGFDIPGDGRWHDGMLIAHAIDERRSVALKAVADSLWPGADDLQKTVKDWLTKERARRKKAAQEAGEELVEPNYSDVPREIMEPYALEDVILTRKVCDHYNNILAQKPELNRVVEFEREVSDALYAIEKRGLPASQTDYRKLEHEVVENLEALEDRVLKLVAEGDRAVFLKELGKEVEVSEDGKTIGWDGSDAEFNPASSAQVLAALKARGANMEFMAKKEGKIVSADAENLGACDDELAAAILDFRTELKVLSTYVRPMIDRSYVRAMRHWKEPFIAPDGRIHATYRQVGARTGRMSCIAEGSFVDAPRDLLRNPRGIKIEDIKPGDYVYSFDAVGVPRPKRVKRVLDQGTKKVLRLVWRAAGNKSYLGELEATPDHRVRLRDGDYKRMDQLQPGDQLAFLSRQVTGDGYARIVWKHGTGDGVASAVDEHRHLIQEGEVVHHIDEQKLNNALENLAPMTVSAHNRLHNPPGPRPERRKACPYTETELRDLLSGGVRNAISSAGHDHKTLRRWADEHEISIPDRRTRDAVPTNHVVVAVLDDGKSVPTYDLTVEDTPNFVVNEIGVHNCSDPNMQNQPRDDLRLRYNIVADPGHKLVACDLSNIEMVLFAAYCGEGALLNAVKNGDDLHELTAKMLGFRDRARSGGTFETARQQGKTYNFSRVYGGGLRTIMRQRRCNLAEARLLKRRFDEAYPEVARLSQRIEWRLHDQGFIADALISGRRFRVDPRDAYKATNYLVQGTAAALLKWAVVQLHKDGVPMVALVHDEIVAHVPESEAEATKRLIIQRMTEHPGLKGVVPLSAEGEIVDRWSQAKDPLWVPNWAKEAA